MQQPSSQADVPPVLYEVADRVALIRFNRPDRLNAWTLQLEDAYLEALRRADADADVGAVVVTGNGRAYCAGADFSHIETVLDPARRRPDRGPRLLRSVAVGKPVIAAVNGVCVGIGLVQACACDIRFASADAKFIAGFPRRGLPAEEGVSWLLPRIVGMGVAMEMMLSGDAVDAAAAKSTGLVNRVFETGLLEGALAFARDIAANCSPSAVAATKRQAYLHGGATLGAALAQSRQVKTRGFATRDPHEGLASFREKRAPAFDPMQDLAAEFPLDLPGD